MSALLDEANGVTRRTAEIHTEAATQQVVVRPREQVGAWLDGSRLLPPGPVNADTWRRTGNRKVGKRKVTVTAPIVAAVGILDGPGTGQARTMPGRGSA